MQDDVVATLTRSSGEHGPCALRDLSPDRARLVGTIEVFEGERVQLAFELAEPLKIAADVTHVDRQRKVIEVVFHGVDAATQAQIERSITAMLARVRAAATVVIAHPAVDVSSALERDLARVGVGARVVGTLDAIDAQLGDGVLGVIIAASFGEAIGPVLQRLEETRRGLKRVLLFGDQIEKIAHPAVGRVDAVLRTPWRFKGLARAFDLSTNDVVTTYDQLVALPDPNKRR